MMNGMERYEEYSRFLDDRGAKDIPVFFVWDRTAALEEGDDKKDALLYPILTEETERDTEMVTRQLNLIAQIIGVMGKVEQEIGQSLPQYIAFENIKYHFMHVGIKYSLGLRRELHYPDKSAHAELRLIYFLFATFYGSFKTLYTHTTQSKQYNPDKDKADELYAVLNFLGQINRPQLAASLGAWTLKPLKVEITPLNPAEKKLSRQLSMMIESVCSIQPVLGALAIYNRKVIFTKDLTTDFEQALVLVLNSGLESEMLIGHRVSFDVQNVFVLRCYLDNKHIRSFPANSDESLYLLIHIRGDLSLTLLVKAPGGIEGFQQSWFRTCTTLKDELLRIHYHHDDPEPSTPPPKAGGINNPTMTVKLHKQSSVVYGNNLTPFTEAGGRKASVANDDAWSDWFNKSMTICQQAFDDMPSVTEITLASPNDYSFQGTQGNVNNTFSGCTNKELKTHLSYD